jgi:hypothetical protein
VIQDGRLSLARTSQQFDLLAIDAFSGDSIPYLITREATSLRQAYQAGRRDRFRRPTALSTSLSRGTLTRRWDFML